VHCALWFSYFNCIKKQFKNTSETQQSSITARSSFGSSARTRSFLSPETKHRKNLRALGEVFRALQGRNAVMRHPREMTGLEIEAFLTMLAIERKVSAFTQA
jgi:hypothetical protein